MSAAFGAHEGLVLSEHAKVLSMEEARCLHSLNIRSGVPPRGRQRAAPFLLLLFGDS